MRGVSWNFVWCSRMDRFDRKERRATFNLVPALYDHIRPKYPIPILQAVEEYAGLTPASRIVEVGPGTGQASEYFIEQGFDFLGIELGAGLLTFAQHKFEGKGNARFINLSFEDWSGPECYFDLLLAAQSFHWIEVECGIKKASEILKPGAAIALIWNVDESQQTEFWQKGFPVIEKYLPDPANQEQPIEHCCRIFIDALNASPLFKELQIKEHKWQKVYSADDWIKMRNTFSPDLSLSTSVRHAFHEDLKAVIEDLGGSLIRYYRTVCTLARRW